MLSKLKADILEGLALVPQMCAFIVRMLPMVALMLPPYLGIGILMRNLPMFSGVSGVFKGWGHYWVSFALELTYITGTIFISFMAQALVVSIIAVRGFRHLEGLQVESILKFGLTQRWALNAHWSFFWSMAWIIALCAGLPAATGTLAAFLLGTSYDLDVYDSFLLKALLGISLYTFILNRMIAIPLAISEAVDKENGNKQIEVSFKPNPEPKLMKRALLLARVRPLPALIALACALLILFPALYLDEWYWNTIVGGELTETQSFLRSIGNGFRFFMFILALNFIAHWQWRGARLTSGNLKQSAQKVRFD
jgi:hypothetical protein